MLQGGNEVEKLVLSDQFLDFHDGYVDNRIREAASDHDPVIASLAKAIVERKAPKLLGEICGLEDRKIGYNPSAMFRLDCKHNLPLLANKFGIPIGQFLVCSPNPIKFEDRSNYLNTREARNLKPEEREELIMIFMNNEPEPKSIVEISNSVVAYCSERAYGISRLYVVVSDETDPKIEEMRREVRKWESLALAA